MKVFVTGGGGFLGRVIIRQLLQQGHQVVSYSRQDYPDLRALGVEHRQGDLAEVRRLTAAMKDCDAVIHTAAKAGFWGDYQDYYRSNVVGSENVLTACRDNGIGKLVYTSSPSVVHPGGQGVEGANESLPYPEHFESFYPQTKSVAERLILAANDANLATVSLRPHLIWGPEDPHFLPRFLARARAGRLKLVGSGEPLVDTVYVDNAAEAHLLALERLQPGAVIAGKAYFITQDEPVSIAHFINSLLQAGGMPPVKRHVPAGLAYLLGGVLETVYKGLNLPGEPMMTRFLAHQLSTPHWFDISAARRELGYAPRVSFEEGMVRLAESLQHKTAV